MNKHFLNILLTCASATLCAALYLGTAGCGDDDDDDDTTTDAGAGKGGGGGSSNAGAGGSTKAGAGGTTKAGAGGGSAGAAGAAPAPITCGTKTCQPSITGIPACCATADTCGLGDAAECTALGQLGTADTNCPDYSMTVAGTAYPVKGCCRPDGKCGVNFATTGLGCVARTAVPSWASGPLEAKTCGTDSGF